MRWLWKTGYGSVQNLTQIEQHSCDVTGMIRVEDLARLLDAAYFLDPGECGMHEFRWNAFNLVAALACGDFDRRFQLYFEVDEEEKPIGRIPRYVRARHLMGIPTELFMIELMGPVILPEFFTRNSDGRLVCYHMCRSMQQLQNMLRQDMISVEGFVGAHVNGIGPIIALNAFEQDSPFCPQTTKDHS